MPPTHPTNRGVTVATLRFLSERINSLPHGVSADALRELSEEAATEYVAADIAAGNGDWWLDSKPGWYVVRYESENVSLQFEYPTENPWNDERLDDHADLSLFVDDEAWVFIEARGHPFARNPSESEMVPVDVVFAQKLCQ